MHLRHVAVVAVMAVLLIGLLALEGGSDCVDVYGEARHRKYGYDHVVHVVNRCAEPVECDV